MKSLNKQMRAFNAYQAKVDALNEELIRKIEALPDNPEIHRIDERCYTISSKALGTTDWSPFHHNFRMQYKFVRAIIENYDINQIERIFQEIVTNGKITMNRTKLKTTDGCEFSGQRSYNFHPDVVRMLRDTLM